MVIYYNKIRGDNQLLTIVKVLFYLQVSNVGRYYLSNSASHVSRTAPDSDRTAQSLQ